MNPRLMRALAPLSAAALAALVAPGLTGASWHGALSAGALVCLIASAWLLVHDSPAGARGQRVAALSLLLLTLPVAQPLAAGIPGWFGALAGLAGACGLGAAALLLREELSRSHTEIDALRSRLARREGDVRAQADRIRRLDLRDPATGLLNRRGFAAAAEQALNHCEDGATPLALLLIEVAEPLPEAGGPDPEGRALRIGHALTSAVRGSDAAGRWDARLLTLLMPACQDPRPAIERLRSSFTQAEPGARLAGITVAAAGPWPDAEGLMAAAQAALAAARRAPKDAEVALWPVDWGLAALTVTSESGVPTPMG